MSEDILGRSKRLERLTVQIEKKREELNALTSEFSEVEKEQKAVARVAHKESERKKARAKADYERSIAEADMEMEALAPFLPKTRKRRSSQSE